MFRSHRNKTTTKSSGERFDFKFSNFQAIQVPKGWDRLFISITSLETGKTLAKSSKALVRNGNCQWTETLSESIWVSQDDTSKEMEECLFKFVVSMGSARSGILGEVIINMADYMTSRASSSVIFPLKKCSHGTILQVKIHCLTPRTQLRADEKSRDANSATEDLDADCPDMDIKSNGSDSSFGRSPRSSSSSKDVGSISRPGELGSRETSFSASGSRHSSDSAKGSLGRESFSPRYNLNDDVDYPIGRQDSTCSQNSAPGSYSIDDPNQFLFNTRTTGSSHVIATSSMRNGGSSKNLLDTAEDTIEELRAEAKMWERNARKLMLDLDILRKEFSDQSKNQANLDMELSAAYTERDGLKKEFEQLKSFLEESMLKQAAREEPAFQAQGASHMQKELEEEMKFQKESNANLALQLERSQESNIELVSVLQELEETIEKQKSEIQNLSVLQTKFTIMEDSIQAHLEENRNLALELQQQQESEKSLIDNIHLLEQALEEKNHELENERSLNNRKLLDIETEYNNNLSAKEEEIVSLEAKLSQAPVERNAEMRSVDEGDANLIGEIEALKEKVQELERDCDELTDENLELLLKLKELQKNSTSAVSEHKSQIDNHEEELKKKSNEYQLVTLETSEIFSEIFKQLEMSFSLVRKPWYNISPHLNHEFECDLYDVVSLNSTDVVGRKGLAESFLNYMVDLNKVLDARITECEEVLKQDEVEIKERNEDVAEAQKELEDYISKADNLSHTVQELERLKAELEDRISELIKVSLEQRSEVEKHEASLLSKDEEIEVLCQCQRELEAQVSDLQIEKNQLEENIANLQRESNITSKCLDDLRNDLFVLSSSVDSHVSAKKILEMKSSELENGKYELDLQLSKLEQESTRLTERAAGLEAQLKYMTEERESSNLKVENSTSLATSLQNEIARMRIEMETQRVDLEQKLQEMKNRLSGAQEECEDVKRENSKLQATSASFIEECSSLQKSNRELKKETLELHERCMELEAALNESRKSFVDCSKRVKLLEENISSLLQDFASKEERLNSELGVLLQDNKEHKEKLILGENMFNQMCLEKTAEVEKLQREIEDLNMQISVTQDERERIASDTEREVSILREANAEFETALQEVQSKLKQAENELNIFHTQSEMKGQSLVSDLAALKHRQEMLKAENGKLSKLLENYKLSEEKFKTIVNGLELKLTVSEYEHQQLTEETVSLKVQLQKVDYLHEEVLVLKNERNEMKLEKEKLEASLQLISGEFKDLKAENVSFVEKISTLQKAMSDFEDCKRSRVFLEEKLQKMEGDLTAKEALCAHEAELKNELSRIKSANRQFQWKIEQLEKEKDECVKKAQALEEEINLLKDDRKVWNELSGKKYEREGDDGYDVHDQSPDAVKVNPVSRIQLLEDELAEALDANNSYKVQLNRLLTDDKNSHADAPKKPRAEDEVVPKERFERTKSSLETELRDLRERYFQMSLNYAEVEAEREDLVMKLKMAKSGKRWFS